MAFTTIDDDGTVRIKKKRISDIPTYGDWLKFLLKRRAAIEVTDGDADGKSVKRIQPLDRFHEQAFTLSEGEFGTASILCIRCGEPVSLIESGKIRVGCRIQFPTEEQTGPMEFTTSYRVQPVSKSGLGCKGCQMDFLREEASVMRHNDSNASITTLQGTIALVREAMANAAKPTPIGKPTRCLHGLDGRFCAACNRSRPKPVSIKAPTVRVAYIDVGDLLD